MADKYGVGKGVSVDKAKVLAHTVAETGEDGELIFLNRLAARLEQAGVHIPTVTVEFKDLCVQADALVGSAALPTLSNVVLRAVKGLVGRNKNETKELNVLDGISGVLKPGRMTLVLAPPGSGKSVFLKLLAGRVKDFGDLRITGEIKYNGADASEFNLERTAAYAEQSDNHLGSLSVHETLEYAHKFQTEKANLWNAGEELTQSSNVILEGTDVLDVLLELHEFAPGSEGKEGLIDKISDAEFDCFVEKLFGTDAKIEAVINCLGLQRCQHTMVGDAMTRGISGGEKKRLTTAEMLVGPKPLLLMDEISTGLDAATLFSAIKWLKSATHTLRLTTVVTLVQPPPESFFQFDDIILMTGGKIMYHGPIPEAIPFFCSLGFNYPIRKDPASFLQEVVTPIGQQVYAGDSLKGEGSSEVDVTAKGMLVPLDDVQAAYWHSEHGARMNANLANPFNRLDGHPKALVTKKYALPFLESTKAVTARQFIVTRRNKIVAKGRLIQVLIMGLLIGSIYYQVENSLDTSRQLFGLCFLSVMFIAMGNMVQLHITMAQKSIFHKHHYNYFFSSLSYACAMAITQLPFSLVEATIYTLATYFMAGLSLDGARYIITYWFGLFSCGAGLAAMFRLIACITPNMVVANSMGGLLLLLLVVNSGFVIVRKSIPGWWIWAYWISPFAYSMRILVVNEFTSPRWSAKLANSIISIGGNLDQMQLVQANLERSGLNPNQVTIGEIALRQFDFHTERYWIWVGIAYLWGLFVVCTLLSAAALHHISCGKKQATVEDEAAVVKAKEEALQRKLDIQKTQGDIESKRQHFSIAQCLPVQPITLVFQNLSYTVDAGASTKSDSVKDGKLRLLDNITGYACPGVLTALMGGSGAGKTTLMDVIAGRKTQGIVGGEIYVNGYPKDQKTWSRVVGYVEQFDTHSTTATVREALEYSSYLRLDGTVSQSTMRSMVDEVMEVVDLTSSQHSLVGTREGTGLSMEQAKRLSIAVELVANPSVIFMDEPTSGLDAQAAATVMRAAKNICQLGRTIIVTIHQPSIEIFEAFDYLLLLQLGGEMIYFGPLGTESCELIKYLEAIPGVAGIGPGHNPATWMLEVTGGAAKTMVDAADVDFVSVYENHALSKTIAEDAARIIKECSVNHSPLTLSHRYAISISAQIPIIMKKFMILYWRSPSYNVVRMMVTTVTALLFGSMFWGKGDLGDHPGISDVQNAMGVLFAGVSFMGMINLLSSVPMVIAEREVYFRERAASMYSSFPFAIASGVVEIPYLACQAAVFVPVVFFMLQFTLTAEKFFLFFIMFLQSIALYTFFGQMLVYVVPIPALATVLAAGFHFLWTLFNGFMISESQIPEYWKWMNKITPTTYILYGMAVSQLGDNETVMDSVNDPKTVKDFMKDRFGYDYDFRWWCVGILLLFIVVFRVLAMVAMKTTNRTR